MAKLDEPATMLTQFAKTLGLDNDATADKVIVKAKALQEQATQEIESVDPKAYVPRSEFDIVAKELASLQQQATTDKVTASVDAAVATGNHRSGSARSTSI